MSNTQPDRLEGEISELIVSTLKLEGIEPTAIDVGESLFEGGLGLDSIDALEIGIALRKRYGITIETATDEVKASFRDIRSLAKFVRLKRHT
ncbi:phosphopantetheine-binding protein [soil metagenome]